MSSTVRSHEKEIYSFERYQSNRLTLQDLLRQTGLGIKVRFLIALTLIAVLPAIILVLILGDPSGREQQASVAQALALQAEAQANALNQAIELRKSTVVHTAANPSLALTTDGLPQTQNGPTGAENSIVGFDILQTAHQADASSLAWMIVQSDGTITADSSVQSMQARHPLSSSKVITNPNQLLQMVKATAGGTTLKQPVTGVDDRKHTAWMAFAAPVISKIATHNVLLAIFSLSKLAPGSVSTSNMINGEVAVLLDQNENRLLSAGTLASGQDIHTPTPASFKSIQPGNTTFSLITQNPMTGRTDIAVARAIPTLNGRYVLLAPQDTQSVPNNRTLFAGRNTPLLILVILVAVLLVATGVALPIVRPIRRATRRITSTTDEVRQLANDARRMAQEHGLGTSILSGANKRFTGRRQSIIRDSQLIQHTCTTLWPRMQALQQILQSRQSTQPQEVLHILQSFAQGMRQIYDLAVSIGDGLQKDNTLNQLGKAMESAQEISEQFEEAGTQLEQGASDLEYAAKTLL